MKIAANYEQIKMHQINCKINNDILMSFYLIAVIINITSFRNTHSDVKWVIWFYAEEYEAI
jgi:hypothetical protein